MSHFGTFLMGAAVGAVVVVALLWRAVQYWYEGDSGSDKIDV